MAAADRPFDAVLFDWCGTLVEYPTKERRFRQVLQRLGRPHDEQAAAELAIAYRQAASHPDAVESDQQCDLSAANHAATKLLICELAGIDDELAAGIEQSYGDLTTYPTYPETADVIRALHQRGLEMVIVSDFHVDLRPHLASIGVLDLISGCAISCEVGVTKPDHRIFDAALSMLRAPAERCLMVGDNPRPDGGAAALGITTLIIPLQRAPRPPLLERVTSLASPAN